MAARIFTAASLDRRVRCFFVRIPGFASVTDLEYDILDELHFVTTWPALADALRRPSTDLVLRTTAEDLVKRGLIRTYFPDPDSEFAYQPMLFAAHYAQMLYLASKAGLLLMHTR